MTYGIALNDEQRKAIVSLGSIGYEPIWVFYRSSKVRLSDLHDLAKYRVGLGPTDSGSYAIAKKLMAAYNVTVEGNTNFIPDIFPNTEKKFLEGDVDVLLIVTSAGDPLVQRLIRKPDIALYSFDNANAFGKKYNSFEAVTLPAGSMDIYPRLPQKDISLVATTTSVVVKKDMHWICS